MEISRAKMSVVVNTHHVSHLGGSAGEKENDIAASASSVLIRCGSGALANFKRRCKSKSAKEKTGDEVLHVDELCSGVD